MTRKSIWPLAAGVLFVVLVTTLVDVVLHLARVFPPLDQPIDNAQALLATSYRIVIGICGAWLTARLAPAKPMTHVLWLGAIGLLVSAVAAVATWNAGLGPRWYPVAIAALAFPQSWAGGLLALRRQFGAS
jgi:hypothetical protein